MGRVNGEHPAEYLRRQGLTVSEKGARCAEFVYHFYCGWHHFPHHVEKIDWSGAFIEFTHRHDALCTFDGNKLTTLVLMAHDLGIRVEIEPAMRYLRIVLHPRDIDTIAGGWAGHPTMETVLAKWRERNPARPEPTKERP